jgi:hypothetical protein
MTLFKTLLYLICPPYRRKVDRDWAWYKCCHALRYLLLENAHDTQASLDAAEILSAKMKELA